MKTRIANHTEIIIYNPKLENRIKCDASRSGLEAALEQLTVNGWKPIFLQLDFYLVMKSVVASMNLKLEWFGP